MENKATFEGSLAQLEEIVKKLESGENSLEESIELYKKGASLCAECSAYLESAKLTIKTISDTEVTDND